jgi:hypothetical protein
MRSHIPSAIVILMCCAVSGCDDDGVATVTTSPSPFVNRLDFVTIRPTVIARQSFPSCAPLASFPVPFTVNVAAAASPIILSEVRFQSTDPFRTTAPITIFDSSSLTRRFGSSLEVARFGTRDFAFVHDVGCVTNSSIVNVSVVTTDRSGFGRMSAVQVPIR